MARDLRVIVLAAVVAGVFAGQSRLSAAGQAQEQSLEQAWSKDLDLQPASPETKVKEYESPIQRVVRLLTEMKGQLEKEAEKDGELYDQMVCWCETNEKEKTKAIADANAKDLELTAEIEERSARHGVLSTEMDQTKKEIAQETQALSEATGIREKEAGEFRDNEKDMVQAITNLKNAVQVLSKHHGGSLTQLSAEDLAAMKVVLQDVAMKHEIMLGDHQDAKATRASLSTALISVQEGASSSLRGLQAALNAYGEAASDVLPAKFAAEVLARSAKAQTSGAFVQKGAQPAGAGESYTPRSGVIFGILKQMKEEFENNLSNSQKDESKGSEDYTALRASKEEQIAAARAKLDAMLQEKADNSKGLYDAKEDLELTRTQRTADVEFLRNLKLTCNGLDKQWEQRSKTRSEEISAVAEAIAIITEDDSADLMRKTVTLVQESLQTTAAERAMRSRIASVLRRAAQQPVFDDLLDAWHGRGGVSGIDTPHAQLSTLAVSAELDAFTKVKEAMDAMVAELKVQQEEEVNHKQFCTTQFNENEQQTYVKTEEKEDLERLIEELGATMERLAKEIQEAQAQIGEAKVAIKKSGETREQENAEFQTTVADQRATQAILKKALTRLEAFYKKKALLQERQAPVPPVHFQPMKSHAGASPVMGLIEQIIEESKAVEDEAVAGEASAQTAYEKFVKDSNAIIDGLENAVTEKTKGKAQAEAEREQAKTDLQNTTGELDDLAAYKADLHDQCDFVVKNFDLRQAARLAEIEAIQEAKSILSGMQSN